MQDDLGYDKEEEYFYRKNQELLAKKRAERHPEQQDADRVLHDEAATAGSRHRPPATGVRITP